MSAADMLANFDLFPLPFFQKPKIFMPQILRLLVLNCSALDYAINYYAPRHHICSRNGMVLSLEKTWSLITLSFVPELLPDAFSCGNCVRSAILIASLFWGKVSALFILRILTNFRIDIGTERDRNKLYRKYVHKSLRKCQNKLSLPLLNAY